MSPGHGPQSGFGRRRTRARCFIATLSTADLAVGRRQPGCQSACHDDVALARLLGPRRPDPALWPLQVS
jgi:hypothetical protein